MITLHRPIARLVLALALLVLAAPACRLPVPGVPGPSGSGGNTGNNGGSGTTGGTAGQTGSNTGSAPTPSPGDNSALEQLALERINRARLRPLEEAARYSIDLNEGITGSPLGSGPRQPLAFHPTLTGIARQHGQDMLNRDFFEHDNPDGLSPFDRMTNAGYPFQFAGENLAWRGSTGPIVESDTVERQHQDLFVDADIPGRGHRVVMLGDNYREVGVGVVRGAFFDARTRTNYNNSVMLVCDFGARLNSPRFITGVVYNDVNRNGRYDFGEGQSNSSVIVNGVATSTNSGGGYAIAVQTTGFYTVQFASGGPANVSVGSSNVKVDQVDGNQVVVNLGLGPL